MDGQTRTVITWVEFFRIIPEFRILRPTFNRMQIIIASLIFFQNIKTIDHLNLKLLMCCRHTTSFKTLIFKFRILEILNFHLSDYSAHLWVVHQASDLYYVMFHKAPF